MNATGNMRGNFDLSFKKIIGHEGGYTNDPRDRGGPTKYGVILKVLRTWRGYDEDDPTITAADVEALTLAEAKKIFRARYWDLLKCDQMPDGIDYVTVDYGYNSGVNRSAKFLQQQLKVDGLYKGRVDGQIGAGTLKAANQIEDVTDFIDRFQDARLAYLKTIYGWPTYKNGWTKRVKQVRADGIAMATGRKTIEAGLTRVPTHDADPAAYAASKSPEQTGLQTAGMGGFGSMATETAQQIAPHIEAFMVLKILFLVLTVAGAAYAAWALYKRNTSVGGDDTDDTDARRAVDTATQQARARCF